MGYSLGVDLGTTFVAAAIAVRIKAPEIFPLGDRAPEIPAIVYLREDGALLTGEAASARAMSSPERAIREFKRRLGDPTPVTLGGQPHNVTVLLGTLLRDVVQKVKATQGEPPDHVVLTHPVNWDSPRRALFEEVPRYAGVKDPLLVSEPEAAAAHYAASRQLLDGEIAAVYDLGGGTFDATVLRKQPGGIEILGVPEGIDKLGGVDFDDAIVSYVDEVSNGTLSGLDQRDPQTMAALARLRQDCVLAKEYLSVDTEATIPVLLPGRHFDVRITRSDFEKMARAPIESTIEALSRTLQSAQVEPTDLSAVLLVGGSSRIPLVAQMVSTELGRPTRVDTHPKYAVALGAATLAAQPTQIPVPKNGSRLHIPVPRSPQTLPTGPAKPKITSTPRPIPTPATGRSVDISSETRPKPPPTYPAPPVDERQGDWGAGPADPPTESPMLIPPDTTGPSNSPSGIRFAQWSSAAFSTLGSRGFLFAATATLILAGLVAFGVLVATGVLGRQEPTPTPTAAPPPPPVPTNGPEVPIPALGPAILVGNTPAFVTVSPNGRHAYIANRDPQVITVLDTAENQVTARIPIPAGPPQFLAFSVDGHTLYVTIYNDQRTIHAIDVIDTRSNTVTATIPQPARPFLPAVAPDGKRLYVPNHDIGQVSVIDTANNKVISQVRVPSNPHSVAFSRDGSRAYAANHESNLVSVIDTATLNVFATIPVGDSPHSVAVNLQRPVVAAVNYHADSVSVIDTTTLKVVATIPVGKNPRDIIWAPDGRFAYVVNEGSNNVSVIDANANQVTATLPTGDGPTSIAVLPNSRQAYVTNLNSGTLRVLELTG